MQECDENRNQAVHRGNEAAFQRVTCVPELVHLPADASSVLDGDPSMHTRYHE
jgi:hypothetical protein